MILETNWSICGIACCVTHLYRWTWIGNSQSHNLFWSITLIAIQEESSSKFRCWSEWHNGSWTRNKGLWKKI